MTPNENRLLIQGLGGRGHSRAPTIFPVRSTRKVPEIYYTTASETCTVRATAMVINKITIFHM